MEFAIAWFVVLVAVFFFLVVRPQRRSMAEHRVLLESLQVGDEVITAGGIYGIVANAPQDSEYVWLRLEESGSTRIKVLRSSISRARIGPTSC